MNKKQFDKFIEISKGLMPDNFPYKTFHTTFILKKNRIMRIGVNSFKTHPKNLRLDHRGRSDNTDIRQYVSVHSELSAVLKYGKEDCSDCIFVNVRIDKNGNPSMSAPCLGCQDLFEQVGYKRIFYTDSDGIFQKWR